MQPLSFVQPRTIAESSLYAYTIFFAGIIVLILIATGIYLRIKKRRFMQEKQVQEFFDHWLSEALFGDFSNGAAVEVPPMLQDLPHNRIARQYAINQLINTRKNLTGVAARNVVSLYEQLGLRDTSVRKLHSHVWYLRAKGIHELYMMEQQDTKPLIQQYTNSQNEYVRLEAQTAMLSFEGFAGLHFLNTLTRPMNNWQQVKLLDQLLPLDPGHFEQLPQWLRSPVDSVVEFALKLAEIYQQMQVKEEATACLQHPSLKVQVQAVKTLTRIGDEASAAILVALYATAGTQLRKAILNALEHIASDQERPFLEQELENGNPAVQLQAARIVANCCTNGMQLLQQKAQVAPVYDRIFLHIKSLRARS
ncbi:HEAT repeat domain-containing protein [Chitinophaga sp.]|uniref:HEAT repeat domain-containing protein n=1 Tax=Chitinophaga sp. TaxID=1869181 RepID=UPI0031DB18E4